MAAKTRADLVGEVGRRFGHYRLSTATGGSTSTVVDTGALYEPDDYWVGHYVYVVTDAGGAGAAPEGEERPVTDYVQSTGTLTVSPVFSAGVGSGDEYELLMVPRADLEAAINAGVRSAGETWLVPKTDVTTVTIADDDYDYNLPTDLARMLSVWVRDATDVGWRPVPGKNWRVSGTPGGPQVLRLDSLAGLAADDSVLLEYLARPSELSADSSTLGLGEPAESELVEFVVNFALFWLHDQAASGAPESGAYRPHLTQAQFYLELAEKVRTRAARWHGAGTARTGRWARSRG